MLDKGSTFSINESFGSAEKNFGISFSEANTKICLILHYICDNSYLIVNGKEIYKFKASNKNFNFQLNFV